MTTRRFGRREVELTNQHKVLFPDDGITKGDLVEYYAKVAPRILPWLKNRPLAVERFPDGIDAGGFFQKQAGRHRPAWIGTIRVRKEGGSQDLVVCNDVATLAWLANQAAIVLHPWLSRAPRVDFPDVLVLDLDPPTGDFEEVRAAARRCRELLERCRVRAYLKTTGSKGLHVVVPLQARASFDVVRDAARRLAALLAERHPGELTIEQRKDKRRGRVYLDVARNAYAQTAVAPWSVRALPGAPVSTPIEWKELASRSLHSQRYTIADALRRRVDPWAGFGRSRCSVRQLLQGVERLET